MGSAISDVAVIGLGKVGELVAVLLREAGFTVRAYDARATDERRLDVSDSSALADVLAKVDAVVSCLPYHRNADVAKAAHAAGVHYFDLTEDVETTNGMIALAKQGASAVLAPQCGLAPGLIGIIGSSLAAQFDHVRSIELKVGALPQNPTGLLGYAFNWSPEGVVNEYLNDCEVITHGKRQMVPAMTGAERVVIGGIEMEAALTSGGLGTMCRTYEGRVDRLDYKTLRYPGHFELMRFLFDELNLRERRDVAGQILVSAKPPVNDDVVFLHASVEGSLGGQSMRHNDVRTFYPRRIAGQTWRAIAWTTAASAVAVVELVASGNLPSTGFIQQEDISLQALTSTQAGRLVVTTEGQPA